MGQSVLRTFFNLVLIGILPLSAKCEGPNVQWWEYKERDGLDYGQFTRVDICGGNKARCLETIKSAVSNALRNNTQGDEIQANCEKDDSITDNMFAQVCWLRQKSYDVNQAAKITLYEGDEIQASCEKDDSITDNMFTQVCWLRQKSYDVNQAAKITVYEVQFYVRKGNGTMYGRESYPYGFI
ncbi:hypothetical protein M8J77_022936 [Diaphorina citri]|nr:hypothetical protein M8J77_022936 [Diaphorina citri]